MNSRWQANKIGLIDFWYYDEQEFPFVKGRMLLRGSNGSGKSVTMQSVVPLLLDGNLSPERLDPFGSKDRKMSSYLLEEDDGREERTGYLYLEFKRQSSETYLTIGMGIRARRGKPLTKWYFALTDGRRIGKDFFLYKQMGEKVTLSKKELENRIGSGGQVLERQAEYMEYVNRLIFGFETIEEYKEMVDLLIQLRTPKLSKDFKPSVINEILSDSLQPLSDDDLRPMSEAIENMDSMNMNLKSRKEAKLAAEKIGAVWKKYNQKILYEKAARCTEIKRKLEDTQKAEKEYRTTIQLWEQEIKELEQQLLQMEDKRLSMEKEKESLNKSDAVALKIRETELEQEIESYKNAIKEKEKFLDEKREQYQENEEKIKANEEKRYEKKKELGNLLEMMQEEAEEMAFEEHSFMQGELIEHKNESYRFDLHEQQFSHVKEKIFQGTDLLSEVRQMERKKDELIQKRERQIRELDGLQKKIAELEALFVQTQNEWKESLYSWNGANQELHLEQGMLQALSAFVDSYDENADYAFLKQQVADVWIDSKNKMETERNRKKLARAEREEEQQKVREELSAWEGKKEPQPPRSEAVLRNRQRLDAEKIPYQEFYKLLEFGSELEEETCDRLEEALLHMGILDALVVDEQYKEKVLRLEKGCEDRYLFAENTSADQSLLTLLELNEECNDIFSNQRICTILGSISYGESGLCSIGEDGTYQMGVLAGTITGEYKAGFLGTKARERQRQEKIRECRERLEVLAEEIGKLKKEEALIEARERQLYLEYEAFPTDEDIRAALQMLLAREREYAQLKTEHDTLETEVKAFLEELKEKKKVVFEIAEGLYLNCTYEVFLAAKEAAERYEKHLIALKGVHELYLNCVNYIEDLERHREDLDDDMEQIRYDISGSRREWNRRNEELLSIREQLTLTDYEAIKRQLDQCISWLKAYPQALQECSTKSARRQSDVQRMKEQLLEMAEKIAEYGIRYDYYATCYEQEWNLGYVELPEELGKEAEMVCTYLETEAKLWNKDSIVADLNKVYFENRGFLADYKVMQNELFEESDTLNGNGTSSAKRLDITARYKGVKITFASLLSHLEEDIRELENLIKDGDRELFEDILANTVSRKIRGKINASNLWVQKMNTLMNAMDTSSGLRLSLKWRSKTAEQEEQLDTRELVELLKRDYRAMSEEEAERLSAHFRSKVEIARRNAKDSAGMISFYQIMKETLDYRKWFEFQLFTQKSGERQKELTNSVFGTFSGGEKAMAMYVPLFSAVVAKYQGGREDAPRLISLDEAFAGVDNRNIRDMFRLMTEFQFDFIINSQVLWGDCDTLDALAIYQLIRPENAKFVTIMPYLWNGQRKELLEDEQSVEERGREMERSEENRMSGLFSARADLGATV